LGHLNSCPNALFGYLFGLLAQWMALGKETIGLVGIAGGILVVAPGGRFDRQKKWVGAKKIL